MHDFSLSPKMVDGYHIHMIFKTWMEGSVCVLCTFGAKKLIKYLRTYFDHFVQGLSVHRVGCRRAIIIRRVTTTATNITAIITATSTAVIPAA